MTTLETMDLAEAPMSNLRQLAEAKFGPIRTRNEFPPIPDRRFDWSATFDNYEPGAPYGVGPTAQDAIEDLLGVVEDDLCEPDPDEPTPLADKRDHARDLLKHA